MTGRIFCKYCLCTLPSRTSKRPINPLQPYMTSPLRHTSSTSPPLSSQLCSLHSFAAASKCRPPSTYGMTDNDASTNGASHISSSAAAATSDEFASTNVSRPATKPPPRTFSNSSASFPSTVDISNDTLEVSESYASSTYRQPRTEHLSESETTLEDVCKDMWESVAGFLEEDWSGQSEADSLMRRVQEQMRVSLQVLEEALQRYSIDALSLSYNGGKDCLVLLILYLAALHKHFKPQPSTTSSSTSTTTPTPPSASASKFPTALNSIYILPPSPFPAVDAFVRASTRTYHLSLASSTLPMKAAFQEYLDRNAHIRAIFVGTRRTDPHGERLGFFDPTDGGWPRFMRVHPVVEWRYGEVWAFIRHLRIPYCPLYDLGYTSLGGTDDTNPNPALEDAGDPGRFRPAWALQDDGAERAGRESGGGSGSGSGGAGEKREALAPTKSL